MSPPPPPGSGPPSPSPARGRRTRVWVRPALVLVARRGALPVEPDASAATRTRITRPPAKAASESWKAWFFGALDPAASSRSTSRRCRCGCMGLSARVLGFSSFSRAAAAGAVHDRRGRRCCSRPSGASFGPAAGLIAARALAITPVTIAIGAGQQPGRAARPAARRLRLPRWCARSSRAAPSTSCWAGAVVGLAFMTKMLQGWMIVPALGARRTCVAGPPRAARRACASWRSRAWRWSA